MEYFVEPEEAFTRDEGLSSVPRITRVLARQR